VTERSDRHFRLLLGTAAFVIIAAGIRVAAELLNSILLAMLLTVTVVPAFDAQRRRGVPKALAVVLTSLLLAGVLVVLLAMLGLSGTKLIQVLPHYQERALSLRTGLEGLLRAWGIEPERIFSFELVDPNRLLGLAAGFLSGLGRVLSQALLLILIVAFFLAERGIRDRTFLPGGTTARVARDVRQYLVITALTGLGFSVLVYFLMLALGTDLALVWAVLAFIMNFVPTSASSCRSCRRPFSPSWSSAGSGRWSCSPDSWCSTSSWTTWSSRASCRAAWTSRRWSVCCRW
jgi:AI-2 transport protein TqsA